MEKSFSPENNFFNTSLFRSDIRNRKKKKELLHIRSDDVSYKTELLLLLFVLKIYTKTSVIDCTYSRICIYRNVNFDVSLNISS